MIFPFLFSYFRTNFEYLVEPFDLKYEFYILSWFLYVHFFLHKTTKNSKKRQGFPYLNYLLNLLSYYLP
ncbi:hypothetical protein D8858_09325 [Streptococcus oralis]|uniref:Uncharacterized protein n=1 Tax=Streptococcus oralis TaxID=1303 RepID=A0A3R9K285_STROR|nr:hypothetical protein D8858_09325 [Streptococcus oralis]